MYLIPYVLCGLIYSGTLIMALRLRAEHGLSTYRGVVARGVITVLLLTFVAVLWYYATEENMESARIELWTRIISAAAFVCLMPQVWADDSTPQEKEQ